jgi:hypothetical protein
MLCLESLEAIAIHIHKKGENSNRFNIKKVKISKAVATLLAPNVLTSADPVMLQFQSSGKCTVV